MKAGTTLHQRNANMPNKMNRKKWLLASLFAISTISALSDSFYYASSISSMPAAVAVTGVLFPYLLAAWVATDSKDRPEIVRSFDYVFFVLMFWMPYLPYYLWRTRGMFGIAMFVGFIALSLSGYFVQLLIYLLYR